jgi:hypothetical protein
VNGIARSTLTTNLTRKRKGKVGYMTSTKDYPMYKGMQDCEVEAAMKIEKVIRGIVGCHFNSEVIEYLLNLMLPMEKR